MSVTVRVDAGAAGKLIKDLSLHAANLVPVFRGKIAPSIATHLRAQYATKGAALGTPWKPISPNTIANRYRVVRGRGKGARSAAKRGQAKAGSAPMMNTLLSYGAFTKLASPVGVRVYKPLLMEYGADVSYMAPHHTPGGFDVHPFGNKKAATVHVPPRFVIPPVWPQLIVSGWEKDMADYITGPK